MVTVPPGEPLSRRLSPNAHVVGAAVGVAVGAAVGAAVGVAVGETVGLLEGDPVGV